MKRSHVLVEVAAMLSVVTVAGSGPVAAAESRKGEVRYDESGKTLLRCPAETEGAFAIPDGVEIVEGEAFSGCSLIRSLTIPPSVRAVQAGLVPWGMGLREIHISDIAAWCGIDFDQMGLIRGFEVDSSNPLAQAHNLYLNGKLVTDLVIPDGVKNIGDMAFIGCDCLRSVSLPSSVTNIGWMAFANCRELEVVKISDGVKSIGDSAFANCTTLLEIKIPDSVTSVGRPIGSFSIVKTGTFSGCTSLRCAVLPKTLREIPVNLFYGCEALREVEIPKSVERIGAGAFYGCKRLTGIEIPTGVTEIGAGADFMIDGKGAFEGSGLHDIEIPDSVEKIGSRTFAECEGLSRVKMGSDTKSIGNDAFYGCKRLKFDASPLPGFKVRNGMIVERTAPLGETLDLTGTKGILDGALGMSKSLPWEDKIDPEFANLRRVIFPDGIKTVNLGTFGSCGNLQEVTIPPSVTEIRYSGAFGKVTMCLKRLKKINIRDIAAWSRTCFDVDITTCTCGHPRGGIPGGSSNPLKGGAALYLDGKKLTEVVVPGSVGRVGKGAFYGYGELKSVVIEDGVKSIGDYAFCGCTNLVSVSIPDSVTNIGYQAFLDCKKLKSIKAPKSIDVKIGTVEALIREMKAAHH